MNTVEFPVVITAINSTSITFKAQSSFMQCPKCARGEGCGAYPWFQGFLFKQAHFYSLPRKQVLQPSSLTINDSAVLQTNRTTMNVLSIMTYGLALLGFFLGLSLSLVGVSEGGQLVAAFSGLIAGILLNKHLSKFYLTHHLRVKKASNGTVTMCEAEN